MGYLREKDYIEDEIENLRKQLKLMEAILHKGKKKKKK
jgi:hypothetical protein